MNRPLFHFPLLLICFLVFGCSRDDRPPETPRATNVDDRHFPQPQFSAGRLLDTVMGVDLDNNGQPEYIVTSIDRNEFVPQTVRADLLQLYRYDEFAHRYIPLVEDSLQWITSIRLIDVTADNRPDVVVDLYGGGNDPVASNGMCIYSGDGGTVRTIFRAFDGAPRLERLERVTGEAIIVQDLLWPDFASHAESSPYTRDILAYRNGGYGSVKSEQARYFLKEAQTFLDQYQSARTEFAFDTTSQINDSSGYYSDTRLFTPAALVLIAFRNAGSQRSVRSFWDSEEGYLRRRLDSTQFATLDSMYVKSVGM